MTLIPNVIIIKLALYFNAKAIYHNPEPHTNKSIQPKHECEKCNLKEKIRETYLNP